MFFSKRFSATALESMALKAANFNFTPAVLKFGFCRIISAISSTSNFSPSSIILFFLMRYLPSGTYRDDLHETSARRIKRIYVSLTVLNVNIFSAKVVK